MWWLVLRSIAAQRTQPAACIGLRLLCRSLALPQAFFLRGIAREKNMDIISLTDEAGAVRW